MTRSLESKLHAGYAIVLTLAAALAFYLPALAATHADWPAPLDDVYIHFDYARAWATGHPFEWIAGQGYSSGETSPLYAVVLALGYAIGFRGMALGRWGAIVAVVAIVTLLRAVRALLIAIDEEDRAASNAWVAWIAAPMFVAIGVLDWSWFSGMEVALFGALVGRTLVAAHRARASFAEVDGVGPVRRAQWVTAAWCTLLVLTRPEAIVITFVLAVAVARSAGRRSGWLVFLRVASPSTCVTALLAIMNRAFTGDAQAAGAVLKLLSANPFLSDVDRAKELVMNLAFVRWKLLGAQLTSEPRAWFLVPLLAFASLASRRTRPLGAACIASSVAFALLVSWNGAARFQNGRYYMPSLVLLLVAASLGTLAIATYKYLRVAALALASLVTYLAFPRIAPAIDFFRDASENIRDQQVEVGRRLARATPSDARILLGDAGAIAYVSERHAIDALGLGGYHGVPFVRAATIGEGATLELIERLPPDERPTHLALYPNWFSAITANFGHEIDRVTLSHNVICGGVTKGIYVADWSALDGPDAFGEGLAYFDALDVGDVVSEREHAYESPAPNGGWPLTDIRASNGRARLFDAGRVIPEGERERFTVARGGSTPARIVVRTDDSAAEVDVTVMHANRSAETEALTRSPASAGSWIEAHATMASGVTTGDAITLFARHGALHDYHVWIEPLTR